MCRPSASLTFISGDGKFFIVMHGFDDAKEPKQISVEVSELVWRAVHDWKGVTPET